MAKNKKKKSHKKRKPKTKKEDTPHVFGQLFIPEDAVIVGGGLVMDDDAAGMFPESLRTWSEYEDDDDE